MGVRKAVLLRVLALLLLLLGMMGLAAAAYPQFGGQCILGTTPVYPYKQVSADSAVGGSTEYASLTASSNTFISLGYPTHDYDTVLKYSALPSLPGDANSDIQVSIQQLVEQVSDKVEQIRQLNFLEEVPVQTISRQQYSQNLRQELAAIPQSSWELNDVTLNALHLLPEGTSLNDNDILGSIYESLVLAYYDASDGTITYIEDEATESDLESILAHELTHAVTDQNFPSAYKFLSTSLTDVNSAVRSLFEGDAQTVEDLYDHSNRTHSLLLPSLPSLSFSTELLQQEDNPKGLALFDSFPYEEGVNFISSLSKKNGWLAVNQAYLNPPESTEQVIHPEKYPREGPIEVTVPNRASDEWHILGENRLGELGLFAMFYNQDMADLAPLRGGRTYSSPLSGGWGGDELVVYKSTNGQFGYIWVVEMDTLKDTREFLAAYEKLLGHLGARQEEGLWQLGEDFLKVQRSGERVIIVRAPSPQAVAQLWPSPSITVVSPNGGENWRTGTTQSITWTSDGLSGQVRIDLSQDGGTTWKTIIPSTPNDGNQPWRVTGKVSTEARIRMVSATDRAVLDASDANLSIELPTITVVSPNGGDNWEIGTTQNITWTSDGLSGKVKIELSRDGGTTWRTIISSLNDGNQAWKATGPAITQARIRVVSVADGAVFDVSDANFTIARP